MARPRLESTHKRTLEEAIDVFQDVVENLNGEISDWKFSLEEQDMTHLPKYKALGVCVSVLEGIVDSLDGIEIPDVLKELEVTYTQRARKADRVFRTNRMANAVVVGESACDELASWLNRHNLAKEYADVESIIVELEGIIERCREVDFPRMYDVA